MFSQTMNNVHHRGTRKLRGPKFPNHRLTPHRAVCGCLLWLMGVAAGAQNPIISTAFTPDPAPFALGDTLYLFADHDEDDAQYFAMRDWQLYSTCDMLNWTYRGTPLTLATFAWARQDDNAWASQAVERDGKWYWYVAAEDTARHLHGIGVAVADHPDGPYTDPIGRPLVPGDWGFIDPCVFIDDDGEAYLFWGNNGLWYAQLGADMTSLASPIMRVETEDSTAFGPLVMKHDYQLGRPTLKTNFEEAPWVYRRGDTYYLEYAAGGVPEHWAYATASSVHGPWHYAGRIMDEARGSFTIHGGTVEFAGRLFLFYHTGTGINGSGFRRSTCVEEYTLAPDGSIPHINATNEGVRTGVGTLSPFLRVEAETMAEGYGLKTDRTAGREHYLRRIHNGAWLRLRNVDFAEGAASVIARVLPMAGGIIEMLVDGKSIARIDVPTGRQGGVSSAEQGEWMEVEAAVGDVCGVHDLTILFRGGDDELMAFDWWQMVLREGNDL